MGESVSFSAKEIRICYTMYNDIQLIIMAGGVGSRFWPMSTPDYPKQFIDVMGVGRSLIQLTVDRLKPICPVENMWVVTNEKYIRIVKEQIPGMSGICSLTMRMYFSFVTTHMFSTGQIGFNLSTVNCIRERPTPITSMNCFG